MTLFGDEHEQASTPTRYPPGEGLKLWWDGWHWSAQYGDEGAVCGDADPFHAIVGALRFAIQGEWAGRVRRGK